MQQMCHVRFCISVSKSSQFDRQAITAIVYALRLLEPWKAPVRDKELSVQQPNFCHTAICKPEKESIADDSCLSHSVSLGRV